MITNAAEHQRISRRSFLARLRERLRYGVLAHELFEQIGRRTGFHIYPYAIFTNTSDEASEQPPPPEFRARLKIRELGVNDTELIDEISAHLGQRSDRLVRRLGRESCVVALVDGSFAGFYWTNTSTLSTPITREPLLTLDRHEACVAFTYVVRQYRGYRVAGALSRAARKALEAEGRTRRYWIISSLNSSSYRHAKHSRGRFQVLERRLLIGLPKLLALDIRLGRKRSEARTRFARVSRAKRPGATSATGAKLRRSG